MSPIGEWILRIQTGSKQIKRKDYLNRLEPLFQEVLTKAREINPSIPEDVKLFMSEDKEPNAFATGRKTVCLTKGLLNYSDEQIKAVFAHELGHLGNKDTDFILLVTIGIL
ncbi:MAG TPA: M48 family metalloprotease [Tissierellaceae bacterium]